MMNKCYMSIVGLSIAAFLFGCSYSSKVIYSDQQSVTVDHNFDMFDDGMKVAISQCKSQGRQVKHESTSCQAGWHRCVSTFKCIETTK